MPTPSKPSHKPRKKNSAYLHPQFPLAAFFWPARGVVSQWTVIPLVLAICAVFRWSLALWPYSGFQAPPMHGDFEAQRHWMELTTHLPVSRWYFYDLQWWGLDYPPLTAYHSWLFGKIGSTLHSSWFALDTSRGLDDPNLKIYMRATVLVSEYLVYIPAIIVIVRRISRLESVSTWESSIALAAILMQPATILIDHGHFQYNTVMLGLSAAAISSLLAGHARLASFFFVGALGFKQMALFYAPAIFAYLLGICISPRINVLRFITIALVTVLSFAVLFAPLLLGSAYDALREVDIKEYTPPPLISLIPFTLDPQNVLHAPIIQLAQAIHRIFPFARGIFEDKVANIWCAIHTFHKLHIYPQHIVSRFALLATLVAITPPCLIIFAKPRRDLLPLAFATVAWAFFLCSYQVHEKNILLPLMPMTLLLATHDGLKPYMRSWIGFANVLGSWTLYPLLKRDGLQVPYYVLTLLWMYLLGLPLQSIAGYGSGAPTAKSGMWTTLFHIPIYMAMAAWHIAEAWVQPPARYPDLWVVLNVLIGAGGFGLCYLWCLLSLVQRAGVGVGTKQKTV